MITVRIKIFGEYFTNNSSTLFDNKNEERIRIAT